MITTKQLKIEELGSTKTGSAWAFKSLHPSTEQPDCIGIPDGDSHLITYTTYNANLVIANTGTASDWEADIIMSAHPIYPISYCTYNLTTAIPTSVAVPNDQIEGNSETLKTESFAALCEAYRPVYQSLTLVYDAPSLSNQGTIACAQYPYPYSYFSPTSSGLSFNKLCRLYDPEDYPTFEELQNIPTSYLGAAREGIYAPMKLFKESREWKYSQDTKCHAQCATNGTYHPYSSNLSGNSMTAEHGWPIMTTGSYYDGASWNGGVAVCESAQDNVVHISIRNIPQEAKLSIYLRSGWEYRVRPGTTLTPYLKMSPEYDRVALEVHDAILRRLADAFPESYNAKDVMLKIIRGIVKAITILSPALIPGIGVPISQISGNVEKIISMKIDQNQEKRKKAKMLKNQNKQLVKKPIQIQVKNKNKK